MIAQVCKYGFQKIQKDMQFRHVETEHDRRSGRTVTIATAHFLSGRFASYMNSPRSALLPLTMVTLLNAASIVQTTSAAVTGAVTDSNGAAITSVHCRYHEINWFCASDASCSGRQLYLAGVPNTNIERDLRPTPDYLNGLGF